MENALHRRTARLLTELVYWPRRAASLTNAMRVNAYMLSLHPRGCSKGRTGCDRYMLAYPDGACEFRHGAAGELQGPYPGWCKHSNNFKTVALSPSAVLES